MRTLVSSLAIFVFLNLLLYLFILTFHNKVTFHAHNYTHSAHHYFADLRLGGKKFNFLRALGQYDAQWYLRIASEGYPKNPRVLDLNDKYVMDGITYAFFPLYPLILHIINLPIKNVELTAFTVTNVLLLLNFLSMYFVVRKLYTKRAALKASFLLFLFPFSIFFRSYFTENVYLLILIWFAYFLIERRWTLSALCLSLLNITKGSGWLLNIFFLYLLVKSIQKKKMSWKKALFLLGIIVFPLAIWIAYNFLQTGNPFYFYFARSGWIGSSPFFALVLNLNNIANFTSLPFHSFYASQVEIVIMFTCILLLIKSQKRLPPELWIISFILFITPFALQYTMGFTRNQIISFPLFIYLAMVLKDIPYLMTIVLFTIGLLLTSLFFVNWYFIG